MSGGVVAWVPLVAALAAGVGAVCRVIVDGAVTVLMRRVSRSAPLPWGIFVVNLSGSFVLGVLLGVLAGQGAETWVMAAAIGAMGGYTTFSTASVDTVRLLREQRRLWALGNGLGMLVGSVLCAWLGFVLGGLLR